MPPGFVFNVKAFRVLTGHQTPPHSLPPDIAAALPSLPSGKKNYYYADVPEEIRSELWRRFIQAIAPLKEAGKLKAAHFQFAPSVTNIPQWRAHVEECVESMAAQRLAVEFRNQTWFAEGPRVHRPGDRRAGASDSPPWPSKPSNSTPW